MILSILLPLRHSNAHILMTWVAWKSRTHLSGYLFNRLPLFTIYLSLWHPQRKGSDHISAGLTYLWESAWGQNSEAESRKVDRDGTLPDVCTPQTCMVLNVPENILKQIPHLDRPNTPRICHGLGILRSSLHEVVDRVNLSKGVQQANTRVPHLYLVYLLYVNLLKFFYLFKKVSNLPGRDCSMWTAAVAGAHQRWRWLLRLQTKYPVFYLLVLQVL